MNRGDLCTYVCILEVDNAVITVLFNILLQVLKSNDNIPLETIKEKRHNCTLFSLWLYYWEAPQQVLRSLWGVRYSTFGSIQPKP